MAAEVVVVLLGRWTAECAVPMLVPFEFGSVTEKTVQSKSVEVVNDAMGERARRGALPLFADVGGRRRLVGEELMWERFGERRVAPAARLPRGLKPSDLRLENE